MVKCFVKRGKCTVLSKQTREVGRKAFKTEGTWNKGRYGHIKLNYMSEDLQAA